jgi:hypothetical protein
MFRSILCYSAERSCAWLAARNSRSSRGSMEEITRAEKKVKWVRDSTSLFEHSG